MQFLDRLSGVLCLLRPVAKDIRGIAQQLLLPLGDLIGVYIEFLDPSGHGQIPLDRRQGNPGLEFRRMGSSFPSHHFSPEPVAHDGGSTCLSPFTVQSVGSSSVNRCWLTMQSKYVSGKITLMRRYLTITTLSMAD